MALDSSATTTWYSVCLIVTDVEGMIRCVYTREQSEVEVLTVNAAVSYVAGGTLDLRRVRTSACKASLSDY